MNQHNGIPDHAGELDCVVVGAGFAGLVAARRVRADGCTVAVLEARDRVGGRTETARVGGVDVDLGGAWVGPDQHHVRSLAAELGIPLVTQWATGDEILLNGSRATRGEGSVAGLDDNGRAELADIVSRLDRMAAEVPPDRPWSAVDAKLWDSQTFATWLAAEVVDPTVRQILEISTRSVFAAEPLQISMLHFLFYLASAGGWAQLVNIEGGAQQDRVKGGMQTLALRMADELKDCIELGQPVRRILHSENGVAVIADATTIRARRVIVAVPPLLASRIDYDPPLPALRDHLSQALHGGSVLKFHAVYARPFWRDAQLSGAIFCLNEPIGVTLDTTPPGNAPGVLTGFVEGADARNFSQLSPEKRRGAVLDFLERALGSQARDLVAYVDRDWSGERWTRGCYGAHLPPGAWTLYGPALRPPVGRIHWAGTETATRWMGYVDGAIESGLRAAEEIIDA